MVNINVQLTVGRI